MEDGTNAEKFVDELNWCINQLELGLQRQSPDSRQTQETMKILKTLRSTKAPMVKKRQAMRNALGDYRKKMKDEEKKSLNAMKHSKFKSTHNKKLFGKSRFFRQSHKKDVVKEQEYEENRLLSINLNSLNLHQSSSNEDVCASSSSSTHCASSSSSQPPGESVGFQNSVDNSQMSLSLGTADMIGDTTCGGNNMFKFCPSDNSFMFSFNDNIKADANEKDKDSQTLNINHSDGDKCPTNSAINSFKYEKSDNSFSFDFNL